MNVFTVIDQKRDAVMRMSEEAFDDIRNKGKWERVISHELTNKCFPNAWLVSNKGDEI